MRRVPYTDSVHHLLSLTGGRVVDQDLGGVFGIAPGHLVSTYFSSFSTGTFRAFASFSSVVIVGSWRPVSSRAR